jgi:PAS domain S-box-containing protein
MGRGQLKGLPGAGYDYAELALPDGAERAAESTAPLTPDRRLRGLDNMAFEAICSLDDDRRWLRVNAAALRVLGASRERVIGRRVDDFTLPEQLPELERLWDQLRREGTLEGPYLVAQDSGSLQPIRYRAAWHYLPGEHLVVALEAPLVPHDPLPAHRLTVRELEIVALAADGHSNQEIAERLVLSAATVKTHLQNTYRKLEVPDRAAAVALALRAGLIT